jgi:hypothetical protein
MTAVRAVASGVSAAAARAVAPVNDTPRANATAASCGNLVVKSGLLRSLTAIIMPPPA